MKHAILDSIFHPNSVAVIGATDQPAKHGNRIVRNLKSFGFEGKIYPVNPNREEIEGLPVYKSIEDIPGSVDLAIILVPALVVPDILEQCSVKNVKGAIIVSGGFTESGEKGRDLERKCLDIARKNNIRIIGPNCAGIFCASSKLHASIATQHPLPGLDFSIISQSGSLRRVSLLKSIEARRTVSNYVNIGNQADLDLSDFLEYFGKYDPSSALVVFIESLKNGRNFIETASNISKDKPIIALVAGVTDAGRSVSASHTGSMVSSTALYRAALKKAGIIHVDDIEQVFGVLSLVLADTKFKDRRLALICPGGGLAVHVADLIESKGLLLPKLGESTQRKIGKSLSQVATIRFNPIDLGAVSSDMFLVSYETCLSALSLDRKIDGIIIITLGDFYFPDQFADLTTKFCKEKPMLVIWMGNGEGVDAAKEKLRIHKIPLFTSAGLAIDALSKYLKVE
ncbi:MAG: CoA-binding protein [Nitrososphaerota archaeon]|nr:CoA-binding protein [Nitrososphaerota archaeon]